MAAPDPPNEAQQPTLALTSAEDKTERLGTGSLATIRDDEGRLSVNLNRRPLIACCICNGASAPQVSQMSTEHLGASVTREPWLKRNEFFCLNLTHL